MITRRIILSFLAITLAATSLRSAETDSQVEARKVALDLAGAFSNDGFKLRDGHWAGTIEKGQPAVLAVNLYAGNQYWFSVGASGKVKKIAVQLFDESGKPLPSESFEDDEMAAAGFSPTISGQYFVSIAPEGAEPGDFCLVYSYK